MIGRFKDVVDKMNFHCIFASADNIITYIVCVHLIASPIFKYSFKHSNYAKIVEIIRPSQDPVM